MTIPDTREYAGSTFPLAVPAANAFLTDPVAVGLVDFLAWWLCKDLNPHLAQMTGHSATAVPAANRHPSDPADHWPRNDKPALYVWWQTSRDAEYTIVQNQRISTYGLMYVGDEVTVPSGAMQYSGIGPLVSRSLSNACDAGLHASYAYNGAAPGTPLWKSLGVRGWRITETQDGRMAPRPAGGGGGRGRRTMGAAAEGQIQRFFPCVMGTVVVTETIAKPVPRDPEDVMGDMTATIRTTETGDLDNPVDFMTRYAPGPDGSEQE